MAAQTPEDVYDLFVDRYLAKDVPGMLAIYEPTARFVTQDERIVDTHEKIGAELSALLALGGTISVDPPDVVMLGELAQLHANWRITGTGTNGDQTISSRTSDIFRRQPDGRWLVVVDNPFGGARA